MTSRSSYKTTWSTSAALAIATLALCVALQTSARLTFVLVCIVAYLPSYLDQSEYTGERYWPGYVHFCQKYLAGPPSTLEYEELLSPDGQYIFCSHPHGLMSIHHGILLAGSSKPSFHELVPLTNRRHLVASVCFKIPLYREYLLWLGCVDARRNIAEKMLKNNKSLIIVVGGIAEQLLSQRGDHTVYVKKRKGHIRLALQYGIPLIPGYAFGETDLYTHSSFLLSFRQAVAKKLSTALLLGYGRSRWVPFLPHEGVQINQVFGKPIPVEKKLEPTQEDVNKLHDIYVSELVRIFNKYKEKYGYKNYELKVV